MSLSCITLGSDERADRSLLFFFFCSSSSVPVSISGAGGNSGASSWGSNSDTFGRFAAFLSRDCRVSEPVLEQVLARYWSWSLFDDGFGADTEPGIVPDDMMNFLRPLLVYVEIPGFMQNPLREDT